MRDVVVVGGSIAGFSAAAELRAGGFDGTLRIVGDEPRRTYERPPLSKGVLAGGDPASTAWSAAEANDLDIEWHLGERAISLDPGGRTVALAAGGRLAYDGLVIATGASPRHLPGRRDLTGVHVLRSLDDALALRAELDAGPSRVVVVGAGFIGCEVAATCRGRGHEVTLVEPLEQPLTRVVGPVVGAVVAELHRSRGVDLRLGTGVEAVLGDACVEQVRLSDGSAVDADVVVVGIGVVPNTGWLRGSGLPADGDGVRCDASTLVAPGITACGDVASWDSPRYGRVRIEHWDNAAEMGRVAGRRLLVPDDDAVAYDPVPWFWSDQYDVRLQVAGRTVAGSGGEFSVTDGSVDDGRFVALYGRGGQVLGALGWNWPARTVRYRMALEEGMDWPDGGGTDRGGRPTSVTRRA